MNGLHVFLNGERGLAVVEALAAAGHGVEVVYVPEGKSADEGLRGRLSATGAEVCGVANVNEPDFISKVEQRAPQLFLVGGFSQIFKQSIIDVPELGTINLHAGRLPGYRGGSPLNWQLINGEKEAGISVVELDSGIDSGRVLAEARIPVGPETDINTLHNEANQLFPELVLGVMETIESTGQLNGVPQDKESARYWHQRNDDDGRIDWHQMKAEEIERFIRALTRPYPGAHTRWGDKEVRIFSAKIPSWNLHGAPGRICYVQGEGPLVVCQDRALLLSDYLVDGANIRLPHGAYLG